MSVRRSKLDIQLIVLNAVKDGVDKPTRIMYASNMAYMPMKKTLDNLVNRGLLSVSSNMVGKKAKRRYMITEKGTSVLNYFEGAKEIVDIM
jgi:predicted transcriptional regulator